MTLFLQMQPNIIALRRVASPCYTVEWIKKHEICQTWEIWLE
jgi:hypothetical protein